jgi:serine/threonine-protein kinase RsbT
MVFSVLESHQVAPNVSLEREVRVRISSSADVVAVRHHGRALASQAGFSNSHLTIIATAISEVARNIVDYAKEGEVVLMLVRALDKQGVHVIATDSGPGIADIRTAMRDGYSSSASLGLGLPGSRRLMDEFDIASEVGKGTTVTMTKWVS